MNHEKQFSEELRNWQIAEIRKGIAEADNQEFVSDTEVNKLVEKWFQPNHHF